MSWRTVQFLPKRPFSFVLDLGEIQEIDPSELSLIQRILLSRHQQYCIAKQMSRDAQYIWSKNYLLPFLSPISLYLINYPQNRKKWFWDSMGGPWWPPNYRDGIRPIKIQRSKQVFSVLFRRTWTFKTWFCNQGPSRMVNPQLNPSSPYRAGVGGPTLTVSRG